MDWFDSLSPLVRRGVPSSRYLGNGPRRFVARPPSMVRTDDTSRRGVAFWTAPSGLVPIRINTCGTPLSGASDLTNARLPDCSVMCVKGHVDSPPTVASSKYDESARPQFTQSRRRSEFVLNSTTADSSSIDDVLVAAARGSGNCRPSSAFDDSM